MIKALAIVLLFNKAQQYTPNGAPATTASASTFLPPVHAIQTGEVNITQNNQGFKHTVSQGSR